MRLKAATAKINGQKEERKWSEQKARDRMNRGVNNKDRCVFRLKKIIIIRIPSRILLSSFPFKRWEINTKTRTKCPATKQTPRPAWKL